jgi:hypothetical protein
MKMRDDSKIFKATRQYWLVIGIAQIIPIAFLAWAIVVLGWQSLLLAILIISIWIIRFSFEITQGLNAYISITPEQFSGKIGKFEFDELWNEIKYVQFSGQGFGKTVTVYTEDKAFVIPCRYFDERKFSQSLLEHLPAEVFEPKAYYQRSRVQEWKQALESKFQGLDHPLHATYGRSERWIGSFSLLLGMAMMGLLYFGVDLTLPVCMFSCFGGLGAILLSYSFSHIEATNDSIRQRVFFREYELRWDSISQVLIDPGTGALFLLGTECELVLPNPIGWHGTERDQLVDLINLQLANHNILPVKNTGRRRWRSKKINS